MGAFKTLFDQISAHKWNVTLSAFFQMLTALLTVVSIPLIIPIFQLLFDRANTSPFASTHLPPSIVDAIEAVMKAYEREQALFYFCMLMVAVFFTKNVSRYLAMYFMTPVRNGILKDLRAKLYDHFQEQDLSYFSTKRTGQILSSFTHDVQEVEWSVLKMVETFFKAPLVIIGSLFFMIMINAQLTIVVLGLLIVVVLVIGGLSRRLKEDSHKSQDLLGKMLSVVEENIFTQKLIKTYQLSDWRRSYFTLLNQEHYQVANKVLWRRDSSSPLSEFLGVSIVVFLMYYASHLVFKNELEPETFFAFIFGFYNIIEPSKSFATAYFSAKKGQAAMERINAQLKVLPNIKFSDDSKEIFEFKDKIVFKNLTFKYPDRAETTLANVNLEIHKNEIIGISGISGAGKSTLIDLLLRFYNYQKGDIRIDDQEISELSQKQLYGLFAVVDQQTNMFNTTIAQNIALDGIYDQKRVISAAEKAGIANFVSSLSKGYDTLSGEKGVKLSGGQKQRIALARAIYRDAPIIILDEATSAVDETSENLIINACETYFRDKTVIIIAHRGKILNLAEKIYDLESGKLKSRVN